MELELLDALRLIIAKAPTVHREALRALRALALDSPVAQHRAERVIEAALGDPEATWSEDERLALAGLLSGAPDGTRTLDVRVRVSETEKDAVLALAAAEGHTVSQLLRQRLGLAPTKD